MGQTSTKERIVDYIYINETASEFTFPIHDISKTVLQSLLQHIDTHDIQHYILHQGMKDRTLTIYAKNETDFAKYMNSMHIGFVLHKIVQNPKDT